MITLGVTGGIGSGKTTVCRILETYGARLFIADRVAKELMRSDPGVRRRLVNAFGPETYRPDGTLDRDYLAATVFSDSEQLQRINRIVHPVVFGVFEETKRRAAAEGASLLVHESAILFESGADRHVDRTLLVVAPEAERIERVVKRDETTGEAVRARMQHQSDSQSLRERATYVIENSGTLGELEEEVRRLYRSLVAPEDGGQSNKPGGS